MLTIHAGLGAGLATEAKPQTFIEKIRDGVLSSLPAVSVLTFVIVAVKVFRASGMEASTTVAVVIGADLVALLEGVILTLLPSFLTALIAAAIWWWGKSLQPDGDKDASRRALLSSDYASAWTLAVVGFFTIPWPWFLILSLPLFLSGLWLHRRSGLWPFRRVRNTGPKWMRRFRTWILVSCVVIGIGNIAYLALARTVWLPLRDVKVEPGKSVELAGKRQPNRLAAFVLSQDDKRVILLLDSPRAVVEVAPDVVAPNPQICIPQAPGLQDVLYLRPVQVVAKILGLEADINSPYPVCP